MTPQGQAQQQQQPGFGPAGRQTGDSGQGGSQQGGGQGQVFELLTKVLDWQQQLIMQLISGQQGGPSQGGGTFQSHQQHQSR